MHIYMYMCVCVRVCINIYVYIYIWIGPFFIRERTRSATAPPPVGNTEGGG